MMRWLRDNTGDSSFLRFAKNAAGDIALPVSALVTSPLLARTLGPSGRGDYSGIVAPLTLATYLLAFGLADAVRFWSAGGHYLSGRAKTAAYMILAAGGGIAVLISWLFGAELVGPGLSFTLLLASFLVIPILASNVRRSELQAAFKFTPVLVERWVQALSRVAGLAVLAGIGAMTVQGAVLTHMGSIALATVILFSVPRSRLTGAQAVDVAPVVAYGAKAWSATLTGQVMLRLDQAIMLPIAGSFQLGLYAVAVSIAELPLVLVSSLRTVVLTQVADKREVGEFASDASRIAVLLLCIGAAIGGLLAPFVIKILFGQRFSGATSMFRILLIATIPGAVSTLTSSALSAVGEPGVVAWSLGAAAVFTLCCLPPAAAAWGGIGASVVSLLAYSLSASINLWSLSRRHQQSVASWLIPRVGDVLRIRTFATRRAEA